MLVLVGLKIKWSSVLGNLEAHYHCNYIAKLYFFGGSTEFFKFLHYFTMLKTNLMRNIIFQILLKYMLGWNENNSKKYLIFLQKLYCTKCFKNQNEEKVNGTSTNNSGKFFNNFTFEFFFLVFGWIFPLFKHPSVHSSRQSLQ